MLCWCHAVGLKSCSRHIAAVPQRASLKVNRKSFCRCSAIFGVNAASQTEPHPSHLSNSGLWTSAVFSFFSLSVFVGLWRCRSSSRCLSLFESSASFLGSSECFSAFISPAFLIFLGPSESFSLVGSGLCLSLCGSCAPFWVVFSTSGRATCRFFNSSSCESFPIWWVWFGRCSTSSAGLWCSSCLFLFPCSSLCFPLLLLTECFLSGSESCFRLTSSVLWLTEKKEVTCLLHWRTGFTRAKFSVTCTKQNITDYQVKA